MNDDSVLNSIKEDDVPFFRQIFDNPLSRQIILEDKNELLFTAARYSLGITRILLNNGADPNYRSGPSGSNEVPLSSAAFNGRFKTAELLLQRGANPNVIDKFSMSPLMYSVKEGYFKVSELLIQHGADPNLPDRDKQTVLHKAMMLKTSLRMVKLLLWATPNAANPNLMDDTDRSPFFYAIAMGKYDAIQAMLESPISANPNYLTEDIVPLQLAINRGNVPVVKLLLNYGANPHIGDYGGDTPFSSAVKDNQIKIVKLFEHLNSLKELSLRSMLVHKIDISKIPDNLKLT